MANSKGDIFLDAEGLPVMEVLLVRRRDNGKLAFPAGFMHTQDTLADNVKRIVCEKALGVQDVSIVLSMLDFIENNSPLITGER